MSLDRLLRIVSLRLRSIFRHPDADRELDEELQYHLEEQIADLVARGVAPAEARTIALRAMGGLERRKDEMRDARRVGLAQDLLRDARYAARTLRRSPGFTAVAVITLALGIGATTAIFTLVNAVLLRPLAYEDPSRLVVVQYAASETVAPATFLDWKAASRSFERSGLAEYWTPSWTGGDKAEQLLALHVGADILPLLGVKPLLGRVFLADEEHAGRNRVAILRYDLWRTRFGGDSSVIGRSITLEGEPYTIVGVMPPDFVFAPFWATGTQLWAPLVLDSRLNDRDGSSLRAFARLKPGVSLDQARGELAAISARLEQEYPGTNQHVTAIPLQEKAVGNVREALLILLAAVGCVLLIACANVAHLQLMRAAARGREFAVRTALGGSRTRLFQQSLVESLMLSVTGGALGLLLAMAGVKLLVALAPPGLPRLGSIRMDAAVFAFTLGASVVAAVLFGVAPALAASRVDVHGTLKEGGRNAPDGRGRRRVRAALVVSEFAMALILLAGAGLVLRSFAALLKVDAGFDVSRTVSMVVSLRGSPSGDPARRAPFFAALIDRVKALPGVEAASAINHVPLNGDDWHFPYAVEGAPLARPGEEAHGQFLVVRPGYFATMDIPIRLGRDFTAQDEQAAAKVVIVNEFLAQRWWPHESALGKRLTVDDAATHPDWFTVVGVVKNVRQGSWAGASEAQMYFPSFQGGAYPWKPQPLISFLSPIEMTLVVRAAHDPAALVLPIQALVREMEKDAPVSQVITMEAARAQWFAAPRFYLMLLGAFAGVAVLLAAVGVYGVISYSVERRRHEIGVRMALGANRREAFELVVRQGMRLALIGGAIGLAGALLATRWLRTLLFGVEATDPVTFGAAAAILAAVALIACCIPARRASRVDPMTALRYE